MSCGSTVENALRKVPGVERAEASFQDASATVWLPPASSVELKDLISAVEDMGFGCTLSPPTLVLNVEGMMCQVEMFCTMILPLWTKNLTVSMLTSHLGFVRNHRRKRAEKRSRCVTC
jgi:copper chaperone CopZ